jgi:hypothetical protein
VNGKKKKEEKEKKKKKKMFLVCWEKVAVQSQLNW